MKKIAKLLLGKFKFNKHLQALSKNNNILFLIPVGLLILTGSSSVTACSDQILTGSMHGCSWVVSARNLDMNGFPAMETVLWRQGISFSTKKPDDSTSFEWTGKYQFYGFRLETDVNKPIDGLNEKGFSAALLWMDEAEFPDGKTENPLALSDLVAWLLSNYQNVDEAYSALKSVEVWYDAANLPAPAHLVLHDASGASLVVEWIEQKPVYITKPSYNGTLTNGPAYNTQLANLDNFNILSNKSGLKMSGLPGDRTSMSRFVALAVLAKYTKQTAVWKDNFLCFLWHKDVYGSVYCAQQLLHLMNRISILRGEVRSEDETGTSMDQTVLTVVRDHKGTCEDNKGPILYYRFCNTATLRQIYVAEEVKQQLVPEAVSIDSLTSPVPVSLPTPFLSPSCQTTSSTKSASIQLKITVPQLLNMDKQGYSCFVFSKTSDGKLLFLNRHKKWENAQQGHLSPFITDSVKSETILIKLAPKQLKKYSGMAIYAGRGISAADMFVTGSFSKVFTIPKSSEQKNFLSNLNQSPDQR